jgi:hypothetical protein
MLGSFATTVASALIAIGAGGAGAHADRGLVAKDTGASANPLAFWGKVDCDPHPQGLTPPEQLLPAGGDTHPMAGGQPQGNTSFRRMTVYDGDWVYGERCELGFNNQEGPTAFYHAGEHWTTYISLRLPPSSPIGEAGWRDVFQMKQAQPYTNPNPSSIFEMQVRDGRWYVGSSWKGVWDAPAEQDVWTRFVFDVHYSTDPSVGSVEISADLNGDGDFSDEDEHSGVIPMATLRAEKGAGTTFEQPGEPIPSHLRAGIYQAKGHDCPRTGAGCSVDVDNVQVVRG